MTLSVLHITFCLCFILLTHTAPCKEQQMWSVHVYYFQEEDNGIASSVLCDVNTQTLPRYSLLSKWQTVLWHMCTCISFLDQFSWNSHCLTSLFTNYHIKFHLNWLINVESKDINLFMTLSRVLFSLHTFPQNSCSLSRILHISCNKFLPTWAKNLENIAKVMYSPIIKVGHILHHHLQNLQLCKGMTLRSPIPIYS
jgi:hypothetical protein